MWLRAFDLLFLLSNLLLVAGAVLTIWGWRRWQRARMIANVATSKVRSVAMGLAELKGRARSVKDSRPSMVRSLPCVWNRVTVHKEWNDSRGHRHSVRVFRRETRGPFFLEDETGRILVMPEEAEISGVPTCNVYVTPGTEPPEDIRKFCDLHGVSWRGVRGLNNELYHNNSATTNYNIATESVPTNFVAGVAGFRLRDLFQVAESDKKDVEIKFNQP